MKYLVIVTTLLATLFIPPAFARLGETAEDCNLRYGERYTETVGAGFWAAERKYEKNGVKITIRFLRKNDSSLKAEYIEYRPIDTYTNRLTEVKIAALLENVSTHWTKLAQIMIPPTPIKPPPPSSSKTFASETKKRVITIGETTGLDKKQAEKEARERKELLDSIAARNKAMTELKAKIGKIASYSENSWESSKAYAAGSYSCLTIFSAAYMNAYDHQVEIEEARKAKADATPLKGL